MQPSIFKNDEHKLYDNILSSISMNKFKKFIFHPSDNRDVYAHVCELNEPF